MVMIVNKISDIMENFPGGWLGLSTAIVSVYVSYRLSLFCTNKYRVAATKRKIKQRQEERRQNIEKLRSKIISLKGNFDPNIANLDYRELQRLLSTGKLTAQEVLHAFQYKALTVNDDLNCVTEFLDDAEVRAIQLDRLKPGERGPLHGIPISLKEAVGVAGRDSTVGVAYQIGKKFDKDGVLLQVLIKQGAVPFVRTNLSQGQMSIECSNPIFGVTKNPINSERTPGGSSGGEGALIGSGASVLGIGCDMGGSIRVPSHFCGIAGFKCTADRLSNVGNIPFGLDIVTIAEVYSPLAKNVDTIVDFFKATLVPTLYELDPLLPKMPWNNSLYESTEPLKIGFYTCDGAVEPVAAVERAVLLAKSELESRGHTVVDFQPPDVLHMFEYFLSALSGDGGKHALKYLKGDLIDPCIEALIQNYERPLPQTVKKLMTMLIPRLHPVTKIVIKHECPRDVSDWWDLNAAVEAYRRKFCDQMKSQGISCLICPVLPFPAFPTKQTEYNFMSLTYTSLYNVLNFPAGVVPTTTVTPDDTQKIKDYPNGTDVHNYVREITKGSEGLPVGVQCVGLPFQEETVLRLMKELESSLQPNA